MHQTTFPLKRSAWWIPLPWIIFFSALGYWTFREATTTSDEPFNFRGLAATGHMASSLHWIMFAICVVFVVLGLLSLFASLQREGVVTLTDQSISVPKFSLSGTRQQEISRATISDVYLLETGHNVYLEIEHASGKFSFPRSGFLTPEDFDAVCDALLPEEEDEDEA